MGLGDLFFKPKRPPIGAEYGVTGTSAYDGFITDDYKPNLEGENGVKTYEQMRRGDAQVYAALQAVKLPILAADWYVETSKKEDSVLAKEQADFLEKNLETLNLQKQLTRLLTALDFGFKYIEIVYGLNEDGQVYWKRFGDRLQKAHFSWLTKDGKPGVQQQAYTSNIDLETGQRLGVANHTFSIPREKLLIFSFQQEGNNLYGISLLRPAYKHWYFKENLYKIAAISAERYGVGVPLIKVPSEFNTKDMEKAQEIGRNLKSNERSYIAAPKEWEFDILSPKGDSKAGSIKELIDHHDHKILMAVLAPFLDLGSKETGSFALSKDQQSFFVLGLENIARQIANIINEKVRELILINWPTTRDFPKLCFSGIGNIDFAEYSQALSTLASAQLVELTPETKKYVHKIFNLPAPAEQDEEDNELDQLESELSILESELSGEGAKPEADTEKEDVDEIEEPEDEDKEKTSSKALKKGDTKDASVLSETHTSDIEDIKRRITELRNVITQFREQSKSISGVKVKKQFNQSIRSKVEGIRAMIAVGKAGIQAKQGQIEDVKKIDDAITRETKARNRLAQRRNGLNERMERARQAVTTAKTPKDRQAAEARRKAIEDSIDEIESKLRSSEPISFGDFDFQTTVQPTKAERGYQKAVNEEEASLQDAYKSWDELVSQNEQGLRDFVKARLSKAKTRMVGGVAVLASTGNGELRKEIEQGIKKRFATMGDKMLSQKMAGVLMRTSAENAAKAWQAIIEDRKDLAKIDIDMGAIRSFMAGHVSNIKGFTFNEERRILERLHDNFTQEVSLKLAQEQADEIAMNRNILKLSVITHPRALFKNIIYKNASGDGLVMYKMLVPSKVRQALSVAGNTAALLYIIHTANEWNKQNGVKDNANVVGGLGLHHNSQEYFYPVDQANLTAETAIAKEQRKMWIDDLKMRVDEMKTEQPSAAATLVAIAALALLISDDNAPPVSVIE